MSLGSLKNFPFFICLLLSAATIAGPRDDYFLEEGLSAESVKRKSEFLLLWSRQLKDTGISLPAELYPAIVRARFADVSKELDGYADELLMLQDTPERLGTSRLNPMEPSRVGDRVQIIQTYTVGLPLPVGAGILVAKHWQHNIRLQADDEQLANYVTATSDNPDVLLKMSFRICPEKQRQSHFSNREFR